MTLKRILTAKPILIAEAAIILFFAFNVGKEVLRRRLNHSEWPLPGLMLIDGGKPQLNSAALEIGHWKLKIPLISLAKKDEGLYTIYSDRTLLLRALPAHLRLLFAAIRDEAHRFAISYYRKLHRKKLKPNLP